MNEPFCAIIIPVFNQVRHTEQCLNAIVRNTVYSNYQIIVVDNGSQDGTSEFLQEFQKQTDRLKVLSFGENMGYVAANNAAAKMTDADYLVFLNNDTIPRRSWLEGLLAGILEQGAAIVGPKLVYPNVHEINHAGYVLGKSTNAFYSIYHRFMANADFLNRSRDFQAILGACLMIPRKLFFNAGLFSDIGLEDIDLCLKVRSLGGRVRYCSASEVAHYGSLTLRSSSPQALPLRTNDEFASRWPPDSLCSDDFLYYQEDGFRISVTADGSFTLIAAENPAWNCMAEGWRMMNEGNLARALSLFSESVAIEPQNTQAILALTETAIALGDLDLGMQYMEKLLALNPRYLEGFLLLARYYIKKGIIEQALEKLDNLARSEDVPFELMEEAQQLRALDVL